MVFRYVPLERVHEYLQLGWVVGPPLGAPHEYYSALMIWLCDCPVVEPAGGKPREGVHERYDYDRDDYD